MKAILVSAAVFGALLLIFSAGLAVSLSGKIPRSGVPSLVTVENNDLYVNGEEFFVKGVSYSPVPVGEDPRSTSIAYNDWLQDPERYQRDFAMMKIAGINTIRLLNMSPDGVIDVRLMLDSAEEYDIKVVMGHPGPKGEDASDPKVREQTKKEVIEMVRSYKNHPAILMWMIGNEVNYWYPEDGDVRDWYTLLEEITQEVKRIDPNHPVTTANIAMEDLDHFKRLSPSVDIYGTNLYSLSEGSWEALYDVYESERIRKPVLVTEYGADSWNSLTDREDQETQARIVRIGVEEMMEQKMSIGGLIFEWSDEWWKSGDPLRQDCGKDWQPFEKAALPDGWFSEECFGIVAQEVGSKDMVPKEAYYELQKMWSDPTIGTNPTVSFVKINGNELEASVVTYGGVGADVTLHYKTLTGPWQTVKMERDDWRYTAQIPGNAIILTYKIEAVDIYQRSVMKEGREFIF